MNPCESNNDNYPDLTPCDSFLWGHLKNKVYATPPINVDDLRIRVTAEVNILKENLHRSYEKSNEEHEIKSTGLSK